MNRYRILCAAIILFSASAQAADENHASLGYAHYNYSGGHSGEDDRAAELLLKSGRYTHIAGFAEIQKYGLLDKKLLYQNYADLGGRFWSYLSFSYSPDADFVARSDAAFSIYRGFGKLELAAGLRRMAFRNDTAYLFIPGVNIYFSEKISLLNNIVIVAKNTTFTLASTLVLKPDPDRTLRLSAAYGNASEKLTAIQDTARIRTFTAAAGINQRISSRLGAETALSYENREKLYSVNGVNLKVFCYW